MTSSRESAADTRLRGRRILLAVTGGIAAYKAAFLLRLLRKAEAEVVVAMTDSASRFVSPLTFETLSGKPVVTSLWKPALTPELKRDVEHVGLARWADAAIVAPATMNTIGKAARGLADDAVSVFLAAFGGPVLLAPAMNSAMWRNGSTRENMATLKSRGWAVVGPASGDLACGDQDLGRMSEPEEILEALSAMLGARPGLLAGCRVLVSAGPTRERIDAVRFITNPSTGTMGLALAEAAWREGAEVELVAGPGVALTRDEIRRRDIESASEMAEAILSRGEDMDLLFMAAAVADFRPETSEEGKIRKDSAPSALPLERTTDILEELARMGSSAFRVGFAMETGEAEKAALAKLERKQLDLIVANDLNEDGAGFGMATNRVTVLGPSGFRREYPLMDKGELGRELVALAAERFSSGGKGAGVGR